MAISPAQRARTDADFGIKFENDADRQTATAAVQRFLAQKGYKVGQFKDIKSGENNGADGIDGFTTHAQIEKFKKENSEGGLLLTEVALRAVAKPGPVKPTQPTKPAEPQGQAELSYIKARNFVYFRGPTSDAAIRPGSNVDPREVAIDVKPRAGIKETAVRFQRAYVATRNALLGKIDAALQRASTEKDPNKVQTAGTEANALAAKVAELDRAAESLRTSDGAKNKSGADIASQSFALELAYLGQMTNTQIDSQLISMIGGNTQQVLGQMPTAKGYTPVAHAVAETFVAGNPCSFIHDGALVDRNIVVTPNPAFPAARMTAGFYDYLRNVYPAMPEMSSAQFLNFIKITPGLQQAFDTWQQGKETKIPAVFVAIATWPRTTTGSKPAAA